MRERAPARGEEGPWGRLGLSNGNPTGTINLDLPSPARSPVRRSRRRCTTCQRPHSCFGGPGLGLLSANSALDLRDGRLSNKHAAYELPLGVRDSAASLHLHHIPHRQRAGQNANLLLSSFGCEACTPAARLLLIYGRTPKPPTPSRRSRHESQEPESTRIAPRRLSIMSEET